MVLSLAMGAGPPVVSIDPGSVERILSNLLENAIKFSHPMSTIKLTARVLADSLEIEVQERTASMQPLIFTPAGTAFKLCSPLSG